MRVLHSVMPRADQREIALTYISSVFHRSVAFAFPRVCSHCDGCHGDGHRHDAPPGHLGRRLSVVADAHGCLNRRTFPGARGDRGPSAPSACRGCAAGGWRAPWSSPSERGHGTRVWGSSRHLEFGSDLTRGKTESHIRHNKLNRTTPARPTCHVFHVWRHSSPHWQSVTSSPSTLTLASIKNHHTQGKQGQKHRFWWTCGMWRLQVLQRCQKHPLICVLGFSWQRCSSYLKGELCIA